MRFLSQLCLLGLISVSSIGLANNDFLPAKQAFQFSAESLSEKKVQLNWKIAPEYYLYHQQFKVSTNNQAVSFKLPKGQMKDDPTFGITEVHYNQVQTEISVKPNTAYKVIWQGCAKDGLCYPLQSQTLQTDQDGLIPQQLQSTANTFNNTRLSNQIEIGQSNSTNQNSIQNQSNINASSDVLGASQSSNQSQGNTINNPVNQRVLQNSAEQFDRNDIINTEQLHQTQSTNNSSNNAQTEQKSTDNNNTMSLQFNDDLTFFKLLSQDSLFINLVVFFILGILLAFLPCSLPLIPILSTLIIQRHTGYKAVIIALSFVLSMAFIYSLMGVFVAEIGYSFQRWFQSPLIIGLFALLFVLFALNLFGLFQLALPQSLLQKINDLQNRQKSGTVLGAITMGALSALIVGPCMSAPLAGALLFVSQSQSALLGGVYLFILGCGLGLPLFIASVFGTKLLPKPGVWMNHLKVCFGFLMLMMAAYFIRPMLSSQIYAYTFAIICFAMVIYLIRIIKDHQHILGRIALVLLSIGMFIFGVWQIQQGLNSRAIAHAEQELHNWKKVSTLDAFNAQLAHAQALNLPVLVDVYANWCVACQPIKKEVFPRADVQTAMQDFYLIELDLSEYHDSQDQILKQHEILGPPTLLFFEPKGKELRQLRLTGTFKAESLLTQLQKFKSQSK